MDKKRMEEDIESKILRKYGIKNKSLDEWIVDILDEMRVYKRLLGIDVPMDDAVPSSGAPSPKKEAFDAKVGSEAEMAYNPKDKRYDSCKCNRKDVGGGRKREGLNAADCHYCRKCFSKGDEKSVQSGSKRGSKYSRPTTPPGYWDIGFE
jgi:hypothetical protein